jgi:hypothetical protein
MDSKWIAGLGRRRTRTQAQLPLTCGWYKLELPQICYIAESGSLNSPAHLVNAAVSSITLRPLATSVTRATMSHIPKRKPVPLPDHLNIDDKDDIERVSTDIQQPLPAHPKSVKIFGWELSANRAPQGLSAPVPQTSRPTLVQRFNRAFPPHKKYFRMSRRVLCIILLGFFLILLALIIGLAVGLTRASGYKLFTRRVEII